MSKSLVVLSLCIATLLPLTASAADDASAPASAAQQLAASGPLTPVKFRNNWNGLVSQIAAMGTADQAQKLSETLLLGEMTPEAGGKDSTWLARCGDGDRVTLTAATPDSPLTHVTIETPINAAQLGPGRVAPAVMWTLSFFHPERNSEDIKKLAVRLMQGMATQQTSTVEDGTDEYRLSALPDGALRFDAHRTVAAK
ncbi:hypothetical protein [Silvimonas amylolytica]|uniref:Uncharacterized protein n=1 Tax=Silvimonas amylolytica TaxID=449663 RepID=A0ABQ2PJP8_9NEIS|nr:hypothetical protein [Silvimonas amylolytica]GGP25252.1 hypothetical protein GCM10010971_10710 [Silvimonas amylolytica]